MESEQPTHLDRVSPLDKAKAEGRLCLNIEECAPLLNCSRATAFDMARRGILPTILIGIRRRVVPIAALEAMLEGASSPDLPFRPYSGQGGK